MAGKPDGPSEEFEEVQDFSHEPLESRFESKDLNRRCSAYNEVSAEMAKSEGAAIADNSSFDTFRKYMATCFGEALPKGQDAALGALAVYLERCPGVESEATDILGFVRKLVEHKSIDKPKMQQLATTIVLLVAEICECPGVVKALTDCLADLEAAKKKSQGFFKKQVAFVIKLMYHILADFGIQKMSPTLGYATMVLKYIADSDRALREACYSVLVELAAWMGDFPSMAKSMEEPQKKELTKRLEGLSDEEKTRASAKRLYRGEAAQAKLGKGSSKGAAGQYKVDALRQLPKGWCLDKVFSMEKWKEKQQYLQVLVEAVDVKTPLLPGEGYLALVPGLQRLLKAESNIPVLAEAAKCAGILCRGLRADFERPARQLLSAALSRIIDKSVWKPNVLVERVEQMLWSVPFEAFFEEMRPHVSSKSTWSKKEGMGLLLRTLDLPQVQESCPDAAQRFFPTLAAALVPAIDDSDNGVRHEAARCLAVLVHRNHTLPDIATTVGRLPAHRFSSFEEEWRKLAGDLPCPLSCTAADDRPKASQGPSRRASPCARDAGANSARASRPGSPHKRTASPMASQRTVPESPSRQRQPTTARPAQEPQTSSRTSAPLRARSAPRDGPAPLDEESIMESSIVKEMAEEIRVLRSAVARLERAQEAAPSRLRVPSEGSCPRAREGTAPVTPRPRTPQKQRAQSAGAGWQAEPERRLSTQGCGSPVPQRPPARTGTPRNSSGEARLRREGSASSLCRDSSASNLPLGPGFNIECPKQPKQARQQRDRGQHWGPDAIPAEHLAALKESWKSCLPDRVYRGMFADRMEEQLSALQLWRYQVTECLDNVLEVLDMLIKWLTWMLFNTNTQVWKGTLDVLGGLLESLAAAEVQLSDREAQLLAQNILERSGHNIVSIRDTMLSIMRLSMSVYPRLKLLPMVLHALSSKNKRSAACAMRLLGDTLDRQVTSALARSPKDLGTVLKMLEDKDAEIRRAAVHVIASLSQHMDGESYARITQGLHKSTLQLVRTAAARLAPLQPAEESCPDESMLNTTVAEPCHQQVSCAPHQASPRAAPLETPAPSFPTSASASSTSEAQVELPNGTKVAALIQQLVQCGGEDFRSLCGNLKDRVRQMAAAEAPSMAEALVHAMRMYLGHDGCADRCQPLVELLDEFCASKECLLSLPLPTLRGLLKEQLRNLQYSSWTKRMDNGAVILRTLNLSCVMLLNGVHRKTAYSLLLELGTDESEAVASSLVVKCLRKLNKSLGSGRPPELEVQSVLDVVISWLQRVQPRLSQPPVEGREKGMVESAALSLMDGVKEVVDAAQRVCPNVVELWAKVSTGEEGQLVQDWVAQRRSEGMGEKENQPNPEVCKAGGRAVSPCDTGSTTPVKRRLSSPAKLGSPCKARN